MKDRLVCIDDSKQGEAPPEFRVVKGEIYTYDGECDYIDGFIYIKEITVLIPKAFQWQPDYRIAYASRIFRPVDDSFGEWVESTVLQDAILEETLNPPPALPSLLRRLRMYVQRYEPTLNPKMK